MRAACPILWWNSTVAARIGGQTVTAVLSDGNDPEAFCAFVSKFDPVPKAIRLFYHSAAMEHFATQCPNGSRRTVQRALCHRTPVLNDPAAIWAAHRVGDRANGTTLLYVEPDGRLLRVRAALAEMNVQIEAAMPMLVLVEEAAQAEDRGKPRIVLLTANEAAAVYWMTPAGDRHAAFFDGNSARERIGRELIEGFSIFKSAPVFTVVDAGSNAPDLSRWVEGSLPQKPAKILPVEELLSASETLGHHEVCNFLPPISRFTFDHLCQITALVIFFAAVLMGATYLSEIRSARENLTAQRAEEQKLETDIGRLRGNQATMQAAQAILDEAVVASPIKLRFLEALNRARPVQISIQSATLNESSWSVIGRVHEGAGLDKGPFQSFLAALQKDGGWAIASENRAPTAQEPEFTLSGTFP